MTGAIRLAIVGDHASVRQGLRAILEPERDIEVVGEAASAVEALDVVARVRPHVVLLDLALSARSDLAGLRLCGRLTAAPSAPGVLVVTSVLDERLVLEAIHQGARGYVLEDVDAVALGRAIRAVRRGENAFDRHSAAVVVRSLSLGAGRSGNVDELTGREREVLGLLARGLSNEAIGRVLFISPTTAKFHVGNLMRKLGVSRRAEAVYAGSKLGLI